MFALPPLPEDLPPQYRQLIEEMKQRMREGKLEEMAGLQERLMRELQPLQAQAPLLEARARAMEAERPELVFHAPPPLYHRLLTIDTTDLNAQVRRTMIDPTTMVRSFDEFADISRARGDPAREEAVFRRILEDRARTYTAGIRRTSRWRSAIWRKCSSRTATLKQRDRFTSARSRSPKRYTVPTTRRPSSDGRGWSLRSAARGATQDAGEQEDEPSVLGRVHRIG